MKSARALWRDVERESPAEFYDVHPDAASGVELSCPDCGPSIRWHVWDGDVRGWWQRHKSEHAEALV